MIIQGLLDFIRDLLVNWISGVDGLLAGIDAASAGAAVGGAAADAGALLALFVAPGWWPAILSAWGAWLVLWLATALIAIFARRGKAE